MIDWSEAVTDDDLAILLEALDELQDRDEARTRALTLRKERSAVVRAKLLTLRNRRHLDRIPL